MCICTRSYWVNGIGHVTQEECCCFLWYFYCKENERDLISNGLNTHFTILLSQAFMTFTYRNSKKITLWMLKSCQQLYLSFVTVEQSKFQWHKFHTWFLTPWNGRKVIRTGNHVDENDDKRSFLKLSLPDYIWCPFRSRRQKIPNLGSSSCQNQ